MLIEAARRAEAAVKEMLAIANDGTATTDEFVDSLGISKSIAGINSAFQVAGAAAVAGRQRHGDGGAEVLASSAGLSRGEARSQVKTAETLRTLPVARDAIESGRVSASNAKRLAEAVEKTSAAEVESDRGLLAKAESMRPADAPEPRQKTPPTLPESSARAPGLRRRTLPRDCGCLASLPVMVVAVSVRRGTRPESALLGRVVAPGAWSRQQTSQQAANMAASSKRDSRQQTWQQAASVTSGS